MTQAIYRIQRSKFLPVLALVCPLLLNQASAFAASRLERIEFKPSSTVTDIQLHSESVLPYHIAFSSDNKLMIDLDNVTNDGTIDTRFEGISETSTISNVVLQPLNDHSLRIIIRGERLAPPHIGFTPILGSKAPKTASVSNATSPLIPESLGEDIPLDGGLSKAVQPEAIPVSHQAPAKPKINQVGIAHDLPVSSELDVRRPALADNDAFMAGLLSKMTNLPLNAWAPYGVAIFLLLGLGVFILKKAQSLGIQRQNSFESLVEKQSQGQSIGFRQLASAYREEHEEIQENHPSRLYQEPNSQPLLPPEPYQQNDRLKGDSLIGLGRLSQLIDSMAQNPPSQMPAASQQQAQKITQQRIEQAKIEQPKPPQAPKAPSRQAAQQYAQADRQSYLAKAKQKQSNASQDLQRRQLDEEQLRQEVRRANEARQETRQRLQPQASQGDMPKNSSQALNRPGIQQRQATPAKQPKANDVKAPLSGNPEVLNFLKNVADLMEKDGRGNMAQTFRSKAKPIE